MSCVRLCNIPTCILCKTMLYLRQAIEIQQQRLQSPCGAVKIEIAKSFKKVLTHTIVCDIVTPATDKCLLSIPKKLPDLSGGNY